jgi:hypothetical protein
MEDLIQQGTMSAQKDAQLSGNRAKMAQMMEQQEKLAELKSG